MASTPPLTGELFDALNHHFNGGKVPVMCYLSANGDGTGTNNWVGDYSVTPAIAKILPPTGVQYVIYRMIVFIEDSGTLAADEYGAIEALTNGINFRYYRNGSLVSTLNACDPVKTNADYAHVCYDVNYLSFGTGNNYFSARWTFAKSGQPLYLNGDTNDVLQAELNDNFTGLVQHHFNIQGYIL